MATNPFGDPPAVEPGYSPQPLTVVAQPGQEVRIIVAGGGRAATYAWIAGDNNNASPSVSKDNSNASPSVSRDNSNASPSVSRDAIAAAFGGNGYDLPLPPPGYSPRPHLVFATPGQEVRVMAIGTNGTNGNGDMYAALPGPDNSNASPSVSRDGWLR
jgi:hypothetical protein